MLRELPVRTWIVHHPGRPMTLPHLDGGTLARPRARVALIRSYPDQVLPSLHVPRLAVRCLLLRLPILGLIGHVNLLHRLATPASRTTRPRGQVVRWMLPAEPLSARGPRGRLSAR